MELPVRLVAADPLREGRGGVSADKTLTSCLAARTGEFVRCALPNGVRAVVRVELGRQLIDEGGPEVV